MPATWRAVNASGGSEFRDSPRHRRVFFSDVVFPPASNASPADAIDRVLGRVRPRLAEDHVSLGPIERSGSPEQPSASFLSTSNGRSIFSAVVARRASDGGARLVSVTYEEDVPGLDPSCVNRHALELVARVQVSDAAVGDASGAAAPSVVRFTPAAQAELRRQMTPGDTVWIAARRVGNDPSFQLELRTSDDVPRDAPRERVDGIDVAFDRSSIALVDGATVDYSAEGGGFVFQR